MSKSLIAEVPVEKFDFTGFLSSIEEALKDKIESYYIGWYLEESKSKDNVYYELSEEEVGAIKNQDITYEEDFMNNDRIMFVRFVLDGLLWEEDEEYMCGDGTFLGAELYDEINYADFKYPDNGFLVKSKDGVLTFEKATLALGGLCNYFVTAVNNAGYFEKMLVDFVDKYTK